MKKWVNIAVKLGMIALFFLIIFLMSCSHSEHTTFRSTGFLDKSNLSHTDYVNVYKVIDGDTFWVKNKKGKNLKIRLIGIDAPEDRSAFKKKKHPFGKVSKGYLDSLIHDQEIRLEYDIDSLDRFGRTLAYAYLDDTFINEALIKYGYAVLMTIPPNVRYVSQFIEGQNYARSNQLGLWKLYENPVFD
ncbi:thermonuclease family protein [Sphingobacterium faecium]|jgi:micrococcal nuclease|uniref:thermonuclease family protein n=1 Tax=Sphingobacterium faecium TaxID=34087 RepID=UPI00320B5B9E